MAGVEIFGWEIQRKKQTVDNLPSFSPREEDDGALAVQAGGTFGTYLDLEGSAKTEADLVVKYREMSIQPECEAAIDEVINETIVKDDNKRVVDINLDNIKISDKIKNAIIDEFGIVSQLLDINNRGYEIFRRWYIDGRMYYHAIIDESNPSAGLQELRYVDPRKLRKVRAIKRVKKDNIYTNVTHEEFYMYSEKGFKGSSVTGLDNQGLKIASDAIIQITSGLTDKDNKLVLGYLHKAIKPLNQLRILEDATVIYRISRAPERRIFYIDVGNLPKMKAEQYVKDMMARHKNRLVYDATTGDVKDDRKFMTMLEDYWLPRREGGRGTEISTLPSGQNLGEMADVEYFQRKLYQSLNVPISRLNPESSGFNLGRAAEITQDELKFQKFVNRLRLRFSALLINALGKQLILKAIITSEEWEDYKSQIFIDFNHDIYFSELKQTEIFRERLTTLTQLEPYIGSFYSQEWVKKNVLMQNDEEIEEMQKQIKAEPPLVTLNTQQLLGGAEDEPEAPSPKPTSDSSGSKESKAPKKPKTKPTNKIPAAKAPVKTTIVNGIDGPFTRTYPERHLTKADQHRSGSQVKF